jgi:indole-3-glycerol phosphate synthase
MVSNLAKQRGEILDEIMRHHRERLPKVMREVPLEDVRALARMAPPAVDFREALARPEISLIAECKKASPSRGLMVPDYNPVKLARTYVKGGAAAVSVLTDARHFQGKLEHLRDVKEALDEQPSPYFEVRIPVLRKDFIFHPYQIYESRAAGADAVLLIASVLTGSDLRELLALVHELGMNALVEVHSQAELERVLALEPRIVGVNNRNLQTFAVDFENTARLRDQIPEGIVTVAESGIKSPADVRQMVAIGVDAMLVGETLVRSKDVYQATRALVQAGRNA